MADCCAGYNKDLALANVLHLGAIRFGQDYEDSAAAEHLFKTALMVLEHAPDGPQRTEAGIRLTMDLGELYYSKFGRLTEAEELTRRALAKAEWALGEEHICVACAVNNLADISAMQGKHAEAESLYKRAMGLLDRQPCPHTDLFLAVLASYAALMILMGRHDEARQIEDRIVTIKAASKTAAESGNQASAMP